MKSVCLKPMEENQKADSAAVRLQKFLANQGLCSRRHGEAAILAGEVLVNQKPAILGQKVDPLRDEVIFCGECIRPKKEFHRIVLAMNKPLGYICSNFDPSGAPTVFDLLSLYRQQRLFCCGRLDKDSEGLLILTNDGEFAQKLSHPSRGIHKFYRLRLDRPLEKFSQKQMLQGLQDGNDFLSVEAVKTGRGDHCLIEVELAAGRKRHLRRLLEALGYDVKRLLRYQIGAFQLEGIKPGKYIPLSPKQLEKLFRAVEK